MIRVIALILCAARQLPAGLPHAPGRSLGKRCRPVVLPGQDRPHVPGPWCCPTCCAAGRLPTCCPVKIGCRPVLPDVPRSRPIARRAARGAAGPSTPGRLPPRSRPVTREALPARGAARSRSAPRSRPRGAADVLRCRPVADVLPVVLPARQLPAGCPHAPGRSLGEALPARGAAGQDRPHAPGPVVLPTCCAPGRLPDVLRGAACRSTPGRSLGKRCRPRGAAGQDRPHAPGPVVLPTCCAAGRLPTCCPWCCAAGQLPAGHSGSAAGPWCCRSRSAPRSRPRGAADVLRCRPVADVLPVVLPARQLPAGCPHAPGRSLGKRCRPVVLPVKIGPTLPAPRCCRRAALPAGCRRAARGAAGRSTPGRLSHAPGRSLGKRCRPRGAAGQDRPHAPGPVVLPTCCAAGRLPTCCPWCCRRAARIGRAGGSDFAGCAGAILGSLTVLRGSPRKPCAGFSPGRHLRDFRQFRPADRNQRSAIRAAAFGRRSGRRCFGRLTFSILVSFPAVAALPAAYKRAADARPTLPTSHNCRGTSPSCRPLSSSSIAEKLPAGRAPDHTLDPFARCGWSSGGPGRAARRLAA